MQSTTLPKYTFDIIKSITYKFMQGSQKKAPWSSMVFPQSGGGINLQDFNTTQNVIIINRASRLWYKDGSGQKKIWNRNIKYVTLGKLDEGKICNKQGTKPDSAVRQRNLVSE